MSRLFDNASFQTEEVISTLIGSTITGALLSEDGESFGFEVTDKKGVKSQVWVDCDPEGNGSGWLDVQSC